jgi:hypothetical protein
MTNLSGGLPTLRLLKEKIVPKLMEPNLRLMLRADKLLLRPFLLLPRKLSVQLILLLEIRHAKLLINHLHKLASI